MVAMDLDPGRLVSRSPEPDIATSPEQDITLLPYETVATVPLERCPESPSQFDTMVTLPNHRAAFGNGKATQPTQLIEISSPDLPKSPAAPVIQVAASSPVTAPPRKPSGILANAMAPAGTAFRRPFALPPSRPKPQVITINSDDEGPTYKGDSSDSDRENLRKSDIKTSNFFRRNQDKATEKIPESPEARTGSSKFQEITASAFYRPSSSQTVNFAVDPRIRGTSAAGVASVGTGIKRPSDSLADAYGNTSKRHRQIAPSRAQPVVLVDEPEMAIEDIMDYNLRRQTKRLNSMLTSESVQSCYNALILMKGNYDDACDHLISLQEAETNRYIRGSNTVDLTGSEDELQMTPAQKGFSKLLPRLTNENKQQAKKPAQSIQQKWSSTQFVKKPTTKLDVFEEPPKKGRKLVRGRKNASSPPSELPKAIARTAKQIDSDDDSDEADSGVLAPLADESFAGRLLAFFNTCSPYDLADTATISPEVASHIISKRPFKSLDAVAAVEAPNLKPSKSKRKPAPIGERIVEKCEMMLSSYEAVDYLVKKCEDIAKPLAEEMKSWGVNVYGSRDCELDMVSFKDSQQSNHDSGIGTPTSDADDEKLGVAKRSGTNKFFGQPSIMAEGIQLKDYQIVGVNWLALLFKKKLSCILADDMGLGKTCQVIAFLAHLFQKGEKGPHLVVVPAATLENWLKEFHRFCPTLNVEPYYATNPKERLEIASRIDSARDEFNVVVTTYTVAKGKDDFPWLKHFGFCCTIFDEGHVLKNAGSQLASKLIRIESKFRLLLTGTPLQNNLKELISLLTFMMPTLFSEKREELHNIFTHAVKAMDENHEMLLSAQRIVRARSVLAPFILRRKKNQVLKDLPKKERRVEYCEMTPEQMEIYSDFYERARDIRQQREMGLNVTTESTNILMKLRQASIHSLLFRKFYPDKQLPIIAKACLDDDLWRESNPKLIVQELREYSDMEIHTLCANHSVLHHFALDNDEWLASGKVQKTLELLRQFMAEGHRTLIFSQFTMVLDILELVFEREQITYFRLDGMTKVSERQDLIDEFSKEDNDTPVFLLSTKAGGAGINLATANKVIVFDSGFNPQDDIQAENRAHRIGQTKEVEVIRLVSKGTVEEQIYAMGLTKLKLDEQVAGDEVEGKEREKELQRIEDEGRKAVEELFFQKLETNADDQETAVGDDAPAIKTEEQNKITAILDTEAADSANMEAELRKQRDSVHLPERSRAFSSKKA